MKDSHMNAHQFYKALRDARDAGLTIKEFRELHDLTMGQVSSYYKRNRDHFTYSLPTLKGMKKRKARKARKTAGAPQGVAARPAADSTAKKDLGTGVAFVSWA